MKKERIWELDALRGIAILCVIAVHFCFDLVYFAELDLQFPAWALFVQQYGGVVFVVLSGLCATLGSKSFRRGLVVFAAGMLITLVTYVMYRLGMGGNDLVVRFGVLHLLGVCMMLYPLFRKLPVSSLLTMGVVFVVCGYLIRDVRVESPYLFPFGFIRADFESGDYFPLLPHFGWFLLGAVLGKTLYARKKTKLPGKAKDFFLLRFFCWCGRQSLWIFLLHQPVVYGLLELILALRNH